MLINLSFVIITTPEPHPHTRRGFFVHNPTTVKS